MSELAHTLPLYLQIRQHLRNDIHSGRTPSGAKLRTESELMERFGVSRATVRKAMSALVDEGLIRRVPGAGTFVRFRRARSGVTRQWSGHVAIQGIDLHTTLSQAMNELVRGCASMFESLGMAASIFLIDPDDESAHGNIMLNQAIADHRIDGVISTVYVGRKHYLRLQEMGIPVVLTFEWDGMDLPSVSSNTFRRFNGTTLLALEAGWRVPVLVKGPAPYRLGDVVGMDSTLIGFRAVEGFRQALIHRGLPHYPGHVLCSNYRAEEAEVLAAALRDLTPEPDVLIVSGIEVAVALWHVFGGRMPIIATGTGPVREDVCVVKVPMRELGRRAANLLGEYVRDPLRPPRQESLQIDPREARESIFSYRQRFRE